MLPPRSSFFCTLLFLLATALPGLTAPPEEALEKFDRWLDRAKPNAAEGVTLAESRREAMRELIEKNPREAMRRALTPAQRARLPEAVRARVEQRIAGRARLEVICEMPVPGEEPHPPHGVEDDFERFLVIGGKRYRAHVTGAWRSVQTRDAVAVEGVALDGEVALSDEAPPPAAALPPDDGGAGATAPVAGSPTTEGAKTILYIRARFADEAVNYEPIALNTVTSRQAVVDDFLRKNSYGKTSLTTTFTDTVSLPQNASVYKTDFARLLADGRAAALAAGATAGQDWDYTHYALDVIVTSNKPSFAYAGVAYVGGKGAHLRQDYTSLRTAGHEFGHNLGLWHANYWRTDSPSPIGRDAVPGGYVNDGTKAEWIEYGHRFSVMSAQFEDDFNNADKPHFSVVEKAKLDWLAPADIATITTSTGAPIRLYRQDHRDATGIRAIKINLGAGDYTSTTNKRRYWLSYRLGFNTGTMATFLPNGLQIDWSLGTYGSDGAIQLDMTPFTKDVTTFYDNTGSASGSWTIDNTDKEDGILVVGRTYSDAVADIHITPIAKGGTSPNQYLDVVVKIGTAAGDQAPTATLAASATTVNTGQAVTFTTTASDPNGDALAYWWDFGDGSLVAASLNSPGASKSWSAAGLYPVRVVVSDMKGRIASETVVVKVGAPSAVGEIRGRVLQGGQPVADARVSVSNTKAATTDSDGAYVLTGLGSGSYVLAAAKLGLTLAPQFTNPVNVAGATVYARDFLSTQGAPAGSPPLTVTVAPYETKTGRNGVVQFTATGWNSTGTQVAISPTWSVSGGGMIDGSGKFTASTAGGPYTVTATSGGVSGTATVEVTSEIINNAPAITITRPAGTQSGVPEGVGVVLAASVSDDGFPTVPGAVTVAWTLLSGPGTAAFADSAAAETTVLFSTAGTYELRLSANDGELTTTALRTVVVGATSGGAFAEAGGQVVIESENFTGSAAGTGTAGSAWNPTTGKTGYSGARALQALPNSSVNTSDATIGPRLDYAVNFTTTGTYYIWVRMLGPNGSDDSLHAGLDGTAASFGGSGMTDSSNAWTWVGSVNSTRVQVNVTTTGVHTLNVWMREDGTYLDKVLMTTSSTFTPSGTGPSESALGGNVGPLVSAGADQSTAPEVSVNLAGSATDDGLPAPPGTLATAWSVVSGPDGATFSDVTSAVSSVEFSTAGIYALRLTADDGAIATFDDVTVTVKAPPPPIEAWRQTTFGADAGNPDIAGDLADPSGSGIVNILAYALHLDPLNIDFTALPKLSTEAADLVLTYTRAVGATDVMLTPQVSVTLGSWTDEGITLVPEPAGPETQVIHARTPLEGGAKFLRLKVERGGE